MNTLDQLNGADLIDALALLDGVYEHSPWIAQAALAQRPFVSLAHLKYALVQVVHKAPVEAQLSLIRAHPELAGKAMVANGLTAESTSEQSRAGLTHCTPEEFEKLGTLNSAYNARFGFPFILAVRGPRGTGLKRHTIIATMERCLQAHPDEEREECLRNIHRIAELRLNDKFGHVPTTGNQVWDWQEKLAQFSEPDFAAQGQLTVTYLTDAHLAAAHQIAQDMRDCGCDTVQIDAVGNVVGRYTGTDPTAKALMTGSHFDTVRNGGKYDGRLGIYVPLACIAALHKAEKRLPFSIEVIGFSEEEGQRYRATFLGSSALTGDFQNAWLDQQDANGISMRDAMQHAGLRIEDIPDIRRKADDYFGFVEVHIEQGPVLNALGLPLGIVTSINASARFSGEVIGTASHAGTTPMGVRRDAAVAVAELMLYIERRATQDVGSVGTVGMLQVRAGSVNVVPGQCQFSIDMRAPSDGQRDALVKDVLAEFEAICSRRGVQGQLTETMRASAAPSNPQWQARWERAVTALGLPLHRMPSGAGHDAMKIHTLLPQAMLFVRGENGGISHNPLESTTSDDMELAVQAFNQLLNALSQEHANV
ncbi:MAG: 2-oxo-4-hydroxy-4-carboxy-5-ureidoimidazoline decarboxylase [Rhodoferax sp.]|nr:2-oxo-4-hydroxy-4-carboxy-5-ureidoimidazoline decarboxylase [Rhodoferax sp.]